MKKFTEQIRPPLPFAVNATDGTQQQTKPSGRLGRRRDRGHAVVEVAFFAPWLFFLFMGTFDMGFYLHALIATQNAARAAATYTSRATATADDYAGACKYALTELNAMSNVRGLSSCNSTPLIVTATAVTGVDGSPASSVSVTYRTNKLIPIPGLVGQLDVTRTVQMLVR